MKRMNGELLSSLPLSRRAHPQLTFTRVIHRRFSCSTPQSPLHPAPSTLAAFATFPHPLAGRGGGGGLCFSR